jgi:hypothetical protein
MHRFVWPLRYPTPAALAEGDGTFANGVWAPPGRYTVELTVNGEKRSQPLVVEPDPRITMAPAAYARQFALARRIENLRARVAGAIRAAEALHTRLVGRGRIDLDMQVQALTGPQFGEPPQGPPPPGLSTLRSLAGTLAALDAAVDGADVPPTPDAEAGLVLVEPAVEATLGAWSALQRKERLSDGRGGRPDALRPARLPRDGPP